MFSCIYLVILCLQDFFERLADIAHAFPGLPAEGTKLCRCYSVHTLVFMSRILPSLLENLFSSSETLQGIMGTFSHKSLGLNSIKKESDPPNL